MKSLTHSTRPSPRPRLRLGQRVVRHEVICPVCTLVFLSHRSDASTCGPRCRQAYARLSQVEREELRSNIAVAEAHAFIV